MSSESEKGGVFSGVTVYHWMVVLIAAAAWAFDCMDARLFVLARESAVKDLVEGASGAALKTYGANCGFILLEIA